MADGTIKKYHRLNKIESEIIEQFIIAIEENRASDALLMIENSDVLLFDQSTRHQEREYVENLKNKVVGAELLSKKADLFDQVKNERDILLKGISSIWYAMGGILKIASEYDVMEIRKDAALLSKAMWILGMGQMNFDARTATLILNMISFIKGNHEALIENGKLASEHLKPTLPIMKQYNIIPPELLSMLDSIEHKSVDIHTDENGALIDIEISENKALPQK